MVERKEHGQDVERLFSWLKAPMVHYREFAPQVELAEAVATWPLVHKAAVATGMADRNEPAPHADDAVRERLARDRMTLPAAGLELDDVAREGIAAEPAPFEPGLVEPDIVEPVPMAESSRPAYPDHGTAAPGHAPESERGALFGGRYRDRDRAEPPRPHLADRQGRSLEDVFSRLSGARDRLPDPRERSRTALRLDTLFRRPR